MPKYQENRTFECGFFNNKVLNGVNDRVYNAEQMNEPYKAIFSDGVKPNVNGTLGNDLFVESIGGFNIKINIGRGIFGGTYFNNKSEYTIKLDEAGISDRYDLVIVKYDNTDNVRDTFFEVRSVDHIPTSSDLTRNDDIKEYCLAYIKVSTTTSTITQAEITDTRLNQDLCGVITGVYQQLDGKTIVAQWNAEFEKWFNYIKDNFIANATLIRFYSSEYITQKENETIIPINIPEYDSVLDNIVVYVNGICLSDNAFEVLSNSQIQLSVPIAKSNQKVMIEVFKSIDGSQANSVVNEVALLQKQVAKLEKTGTYDYYCNSVDDNVKISELAQAFLEAGNDFATATIKVFGKFVVATPTAQTGTKEDRLRFFNVGKNEKTNRRVIIDFENASQIDMTCDSNKHYVGFYGKQINIKNANIVASCLYVNSSFIMFSENSIVDCENARFYLNANVDSYIADSGTFKDCYMQTTNSASDSYCFKTNDNSLLRLINGEYLSYTGSSTNHSAIVKVDSNNAVAITNAINCPTITRENYYQNYAIDCVNTNTNCLFVATITDLVVNAVESNVFKTIALNKAL